MSHVKLVIQQVIEHRLFVVAVCRHLELLAAINLNPGLSHRLSGLVAVYQIAQEIQCLLHTSAAVAIFRTLGNILDPFEDLLVFRIIWPIGLI